LRRRLNHPEWPRPDLILVDGGVGQVSAVKEVFREKKINIPLVGLAKGSERKRNDLIGTLPKGVKLEVLIRVRDEAHRFAVTYHQKVRSRRMFQ
jgi:excinuclease ABC subunit C